MPRIQRFPRNGDSQALALIEQIYAAAMDGGRWPAVLELLARMTDSELTYLTAYDTAAPRQVVNWWFGGDPALIAEYEQHWVARNVYMQVGAPLQYTGAVMQGEALVPDAEVKRTAYYNDFLRRMDVMHHSGTCLFMERSLIGLLLLVRKLGRPSHTQEDLALLRTLTPHLQRAIAVQRQLGRIELERNATEAALDHLPIGVIILCDAGKVQSYNTVAKAIFAQNDGFSFGQTDLRATHVTRGRELRRLIASACAPTSTEPAGGWLQIPRPSGRRPFVVLVAPLRLPDRTLGLDPPRAIIFITDPERAPEPLEDVLARLYGLTPAESNVTAQLLAGASVAELSEHFLLS